MLTRPEIAAKLADGPCWLRSFHTCKALVNEMIDADELSRVKPPNGAARNMVTLTTIGVARYGVTPPAWAVTEPVTHLMDQLAERVANGEGILDAGRALGMTVMRTRSLWSRIRAGLGRQAV